MICMHGMIKKRVCICKMKVFVYMYIYIYTAYISHTHIHLYIYIHDIYLTHTYTFVCIYIYAPCKDRLCAVLENLRHYPGVLHRIILYPVPVAAALFTRLLIGKTNGAKQTF